MSVDDTTRTESPSPSGPESRIGPYRLVRKLGEGGMGVVWQAEQLEPVRRMVALKLVRWGADSDRVLARFASERQALALMSHSGIAKVFDAGTAPDGRPYFVMEYVPGIAVTEYCDRNRLPMNERLRLFVDICEAVQHAHQKGVLHRDLKPSNILVAVEGNRAVPKIIDFGIAKATGAQLTDDTAFTEAGQLVGTPIYMSPEQADGSALDIDTRSDVYALGVLLYEILTGTTPFTADDLRRAGFGEIRRRILEEDPPVPSARLSTVGDHSRETADRRKTDAATLTRRIRGDLDWIVMKALDKDRTRRYPSASEFAADVMRHLRDEPVSAGPPSASYRARKFVRRHRLGVTAVASVGIALLLGLSGTAYGLLSARAAENRARLEAETSRRVSDFLVRLFKVNDPGEARGNSITAREILDRGVSEIRDGLDGQDAVRARLLETMGAVYQNLGLYRDAAPLLEDALRVREGVSAETPELASTLNALGSLKLLAGDATGSLPLLERALVINERTLGPDHVETARTLRNLGTALMKLDRREPARDALERSVGAYAKALGPDDLDVARVLVNLGLLRRDLRDAAGARADLERAVAIRRAKLPPDHLDLGRALNNLALVERDVGNHADALRTFEEALAILEKSLGPDHPFVLTAVNNVAWELTALGRADAAVPHVERVLAAPLEKRAAFGDDVATVLRAIAVARRASGREAEAREFESRAAGLKGTR